MSVPKGKRQQSRFEAQHQFYKLRTEVTSLVLNDFGFSEEKYRAKMMKYRAAHANAPNIDDIEERWRRKNESFKRWFVDEEGRAVIDLMREIEREFTVGNSIYPSETPAKLMEFLVRRWHMNRAIGLCYSLKQELNYVIRTLPVDVNKFERFAMMIDGQIALYKGVRQADNRLIKPKKDKGEQPRTLEGEITKIFDGIASIIRRIGRIEQRDADNDNG